MSDTALTGIHPRRADGVTAPLNEDWLAVVLGLAIFVLALAALVHVDLIGWVVTTSVWGNFSQALKATSKGYAALGGIGALVATYVALLVVLSAGAAALESDVKRFALAFTAVFWIAYASWIVGNFAHFAAVTPAEQQKFGINWSLKLTNEGGYIFALIAGLIIANFLPRFAEAVKDAVRPELYIKVAIVILGGFFAVTAAGKLSLASSLILRGVAAIVEAYLIYWAVVYFVARKWFGFSREWAAPLASGISICGVSAAIATGGAIRARPVVPVLVSSLVVIFAVVEVLILPFVAQTFLVARAAGRRRLDGARGQDRRRRGRGRRHHRVADPRQERRRRRALSAGLDPRHRGDHQGVHRHLHRHLGLRARLHLDQPHQRHGGDGQGEGRRNLAALSEIHHRLRHHLHRRALSRARHAGGDRRQASRPRSARPTPSASSSSS